MSHLVYCIMREDGNLPGICLPVDADGHAVRVVIEQGLAGVISEVPDPVPPATLGQLQAFVAVVENLHAMRTVLSMRYGCVLPTEGRVETNKEFPNSKTRGNFLTRNFNSGALSR